MLSQIWKLKLPTGPGYSVVEYLSDIRETLGLIPSTDKSKKQIKFPLGSKLF
jgi:hypothetical protein